MGKVKQMKQKKRPDFMVSDRVEQVSTGYTGTIKQWITIGGRTKARVMMHNGDGIRHLSKDEMKRI